MVKVHFRSFIESIDDLKAYFKQLRQELVNRLLEKVYDSGDVPNKFWMSFTKRDFMNVSLR